jgi:hypothetical protein
MAAGSLRNVARGDRQQGAIDREARHYDNVGGDDRREVPCSDVRAPDESYAHSLRRAA